MANRNYTSRRSNILNALAVKLKDIDGSGAFLTDVANNVETRLKFWDDDPEPNVNDIKMETSSKENEVKEAVKQIDTSEVEEKDIPSRSSEGDIKTKTVEKEYKIDDEQSVSQSVKEDIIKSLPDESDPAYFELLLEKIGF